MQVENMKRSICLIKIGEISGTGFFIKIPIPSKENPMHGLMTNNHILNKNNLKPGKSFEIYKGSENSKPIKIQINDKYFVCTSEKIDITFIELSNEIIDKFNPYFHKPSTKKYNNENKKDESIQIFHFPTNKISISHGKIKKIRGSNIYHEIPTDHGSSGSPLLNESYEVIGVHKSRITDKETRIAVKYSSIELYIQKRYDNWNKEKQKTKNKNPVNYYLKAEIKKKVIK
ncbi:trypsin-like cysteine/serine peptidase domain-containing protein [Neocallimastix sp. 'constans']